MMGSALAPEAVRLEAGGFDDVDVFRSGEDGSM
jgi:hypothetical protein